MTTAKKIVLWVLLVIVLFAAVVYATTPKSFGTTGAPARTDKAIDHWTWKHTLGAARPCTISAVSAPESAQCQAIPGSIAAPHCRKATVTGTGWGAPYVWVVKAGMSIDFCYDGPLQGPAIKDHIISASVRTWSAANQLFLWNPEGLQSMVKGGGWRDFNGGSCETYEQCREYLYRRATFRFTRGVWTVKQVANPWLALTVRGDGTDTWSRGL
jgi:hypothetical protein